jgi:hypothetical protein
LSGTYELPFRRGRTFGTNWHPVTNSLLGGWRLNMILTLQDGFPFSVRDTGVRVPDRICDGNLPSSQRTPERWFDYTCFVPHSPLNRPGNAGTNIIIGPGINNVDVGLHKEFSFTETAKVQLRIETFNVFNHPNLIKPASNYFVNTASGAAVTSARDMRDIQLAVKIIF